MESDFSRLSSHMRNQHGQYGTNAPAAVRPGRVFVHVVGKRGGSWGLPKDEDAPRSPSDWLAMFCELDELIERYCLTVWPTEHDSVTEITEILRPQMEMPTPDALAWLRSEIVRFEWAVRIARDCTQAPVRTWPPSVTTQRARPARKRI